MPPDPPPADQSTADQLAEYDDSLANGRPIATPTGLDPALTALVRFIHDCRAGAAVPPSEHPTIPTPRATPAEPPPRARIGPYRVVRQIGAGGMGIVYRAEDTLLGRPVALKVLQPRLANDPDYRERFLREACAGAALRHENIVTVYQAGESDGALYMAMELLPGESLEESLSRGHLPPLTHVLQLARQTALGLQAAHEIGLIHRDVKPANIWLEPRAPATPGDAPFRVKLLDFGLVRSVSGPVADHRLADPRETPPGGRRTQIGEAIGTPEYMAPEQAAGGTVTERTDLYGLGVVLYRLTTGQLPARGGKPTSFTPPPPPRSLNPDVPPWLDRLIARLLEPNPADRPADARAVVRQLDQGLRPEAKWLLPVVALCAAAAAVLLALVLFWPGPDRANRQLPTVAAPPIYEQTFDSTAPGQWPRDWLALHLATRHSTSRVTVDPLPERGPCLQLFGATDGVYAATAFLPLPQFSPPLTIRFRYKPGKEKVHPGRTHEYRLIASLVSDAADREYARAAFVHCDHYAPPPGDERRPKLPPPLQWAEVVMRCDAAGGHLVVTTWIDGRFHSQRPYPAGNARPPGLLLECGVGSVWIDDVRVTTDATDGPAPIVARAWAAAVDGLESFGGAEVRQRFRAVTAANSGTPTDRLLATAAAELADPGDELLVPIKTWGDLSGPILGAAIAPAVRGLAVVDGTKTLWYWPDSVAAVVSRRWPTFTGAIAFAADGKMLFAGHDDGSVSKLDPLDINNELRRPVMADGVTALMRTETGVRAASRTSGAVCEFDAETLEVREKTGPLGPLRGLALARRSFARVTADRNLRVGDRVVGPTGNGGAVALSDDGRRVAFTDAGERIHVWNADGPRSEKTFASRRDVVPYSLLVLPAGRVVAGYQSGRIVAWDADGRPVAYLCGHTDAVVGLAAFPDGKRLLSWSDDGTVRVWELP